MKDKIKDIIAQLIEEGTMKALTEATLSRVWQHLKGGNGFCMITAMKHGKSVEENLKRNRKLMADVKSSGLGYFVVDGWSIENKGKPNEVRNKEDSLFIPGKRRDKTVFDAKKFEKLMVTLGKKYNQDWLIMQLPGEEEIYAYIGGQRSLIAKKWSPDKVANEYTKLRNRGERTFVFTFNEMQMPSNIMSGMCMRAAGQLWDEKKWQESLRFSHECRDKDGKRLWWIKEGDRWYYYKFDENNRKVWFNEAGEKLEGLVK